MQSNKMMKEFKRILKMIARNGSVLLYFEIIYKTAGFMIVFPFIRYLLGLLPGIAGVSYLGQENIGILLRKPTAILLGIGILVLISLYMICEIAALMLLCEKGWHNEKISVPQLIRQTLVRTAKLLGPGRIGVIIMLPAFMLSGFSILSGYMNSFHIPDFILDFIRGDTLLHGIYIAALVFCNILLFLYLFGLPGMLLMNRSFRESWHESLSLLRGKKIRIAGKMLVFLGLFIFLLLLSAAAAAAALGGCTKAFLGEEARGTFLFYLTSWSRAAQIVGGALVSAFLCGIIILCFHKCRDERWQERAHTKTGVKRILLRICGGVVLIYALAFFSETEIGGVFFSPLNEAPKIIAHRAGAAAAPENTLGALSRAIDDGADGAEIDVQQLEDGTLIVMHDTNFKRTTGTDLDVWNADYDMVKDLNAAAYFHGGDRKEAIPTLEEYLKMAKGKIRLMIELKFTGREGGVERDTLELIHKYKMQKECIVASMEPDILRRAKELEPDIETVYISAVLITKKYSLRYVDGYSVETTSLTPEMAAQAHSQGKKVYGWTANTERSMNRLLKCGVDGIVTDNPLLADYCIGQYGENPLLEEIADLL